MKFALLIGLVGLTSEGALVVIAAQADRGPHAECVAKCIATTSHPLPETACAKTCAGAR